MPRDVVTVCCCGTGFDRQIEEEIIADTYRSISGRKWINDGPGSKFGQIRKLEPLMDESKSPTNQRLNAQWKHRANGILGGKGTADNVIMTLQWLWIEYHKQPFTTVNLCGWSRGAVTCIMIAHAIREAGFSAKGVKVNIIALDPVPGGDNDFKVTGTFDQTGRVGSPDSLPPNVNDYESVLMETEWKPCFSCVSPRETSVETDIKEYPLPGSHSDCARWNRPNNPAGKISAHLCHKFLMDHGTELTTDKCLSNRQLVEEYSLCRIKWWNESGKLVRSTSNMRSNRWMGWMASGRIENELRKNIYFINGHHFELFKNTCNELYQSFRKGPGQRTIQASYLNNLQTTMPKTLFALAFLDQVRHPNDKDERAYMVETKVDTSKESALLNQSLQGMIKNPVPNGNQHYRKVWTLDTWQRKSKVAFKARQGRTKAIDELLPTYHAFARINRESGKRILLKIAPLIRDHLGTNTTSKRRVAMFTLGNQVLHALQN